VPTVMIVEDEFFVALDLETIVEDSGYQFDGPYASVAETSEALDRCMPHCAILDVRLKDGEVFPVADRLHIAKVPIIFHSGHADVSDLLDRYPGSQICSKPSTPKQLRSALEAAFA
jgi:FixJ family two-component response regulator